MTFYQELQLNQLRVLGANAGQLVKVLPFSEIK